ncbi:unnamed protein product [Arctia plantaginis]|uniref:Malate dehydrogenase n=1 Tax=Arctia plantaginis TaxID=874455 RepID=A0A8S1AL04_ARCPL|nr:unnamed protein product [Arctia plantaginis]CAB3246068.1 unnamed protein product [Arctia plantaginis]
MISRLNLLTTNMCVFNGSTVVPQRNYKVTVVGASGSVGQNLSMLLKMNKLVSHLALYDVKHKAHDVALDISHINTSATVNGYKGREQLPDALDRASVVVIPASIPRKPGMTQYELFRENANLIRDLTKSIARHCPDAIIAILTGPLNSLVPITSEVLKKEGVYDPRRVMGVTTLDVVRACTFIGEMNCIDPSMVSVPVIGGNSGLSVVPVLSQSNPPLDWCSMPDIQNLTFRIQEGDNEVVKAKGGGKPTLSMAFAASKFTTSVLRALDGEENIVECAYVQTGLDKPSYFAYPVLLGECGVERVIGAGPLNMFEAQLLRKAMPELLSNIRSGVIFATNYHS